MVSECIIVTKYKRKESMIVSFLIHHTRYMFMNNLVIFGAGGTGRRVYHMMKNQYNIISFVDNDSSRWGKEKIEGIEIVSPTELLNMQFDFLALGTFMGCDEIKQQLKQMGISDNKIILGYVEISVNARLLFLKRTAEEMHKKLSVGGGGNLCCGSRSVSW